MTTRIVTTVSELYPLLDLRHVRFYEVSARRKDGFEELGRAAPPSSPRRQELVVSVGATEGWLNYRCRIEVNTEKALLVADTEAQFSLKEQIEQPSKELVNEFSRAIGLPIVIPYLRVQLQQLAKQIGVPIPLLKPLWSPDFERMTMQEPDDNDGGGKDERESTAPTLDPS